VAHCRRCGAEKRQDDGAAELTEMQRHLGFFVADGRVCFGGGFEGAGGGSYRSDCVVLVCGPRWGAAQAAQTWAPISGAPEVGDGPDAGAPPVDGREGERGGRGGLGWERDFGPGAGLSRRGRERGRGGGGSGRKRRKGQLGCLGGRGKKEEKEKRKKHLKR
jgi:hypothetical protein